MSEVQTTPEQYQMSARARRRFIIALFASILLLFIGGAVGYLVSFRHHSICTGNAQWISRTDDGLGGVVYVCPDGKTVTEGLIP